MLIYETLISLLVAAYSVMLPELFTTRTRYTGVAISYNVSYSIAGLLPVLLSALIAFTGIPMIVSISETAEQITNKIMRDVVDPLKDEVAELQSKLGERDESIKDLIEKLALASVEILGQQSRLNSCQQAINAAMDFYTADQEDIVIVARLMYDRLGEACRDE